MKQRVVSQRGKKRMEEYLARNLLVCKAYGAVAALDTAIRKEGELKRPRKWMLKQLNDAKVRVQPLVGPLVAYRTQVKP